MPVTITWRQIRDDTVATEDIKNHTILLEDLSDEVLEAMTWWSALINFVYFWIKPDKHITIEEDQQMTVHWQTPLIIDWDLTIDWELLLYND